VAAFTAHMDVCTKDKPRRYGGRGLRKIRRMNNDACVTVLNGCAGKKCIGISPTVFHSWTDALRGTSGISLRGRGRNTVGLRFAQFISRLYMTSYETLGHIGTRLLSSVSISHTQHEGRGQRYSTFLRGRPGGQTG
jgi:hypothetical protein